MSEAKVVITAVDQTKAAIESAKRNMASIGDTVSRVAGLMGPLGAAALTTAGAVSQLSKALDTMDMLDDMAEKTGVSVEALSKLRFAGETVGTTTEQLSGGLRRLAKLMGEAAGGSDEAAAVFKTMGVSFKDANGNLRDTDKVLQDMAEKFSGWQDGPGKAALAMKVFGKSGEDMIPVLNLGKDGLEKMGTEAERLGIVMSGDAAKAAADFNDNVKTLSLTAEAASAALLSKLLPSLTQISQELLAGIKNSNGFMDAILTMGSINPFKSHSENIRTLTEDLRDLEKERTKLTSNATKFLGNANGFGQIDAEIETVKKQLNYLREVRGYEISAEIKKNAPEWVSRYKPRSNSRDAAPAIAGDKPAKGPNLAPLPQSDFAANFINGLTNQYAGLSGELTKLEEVERMLEVSGDKFTVGQMRQARALAETIDQFKNKKEASDIEEKAMRSLIELQEQAELLYGQSILSLSDEARAMEFNASLIGKTATEVEALRFERELSLRIAQAESLVLTDQNNGLITQIEATQRLTAVQQKANDTRAAFYAMQADQLDQQTNITRGMSEGMKEYFQDVQRFGEASKNAVTSAFHGMEDAMVNFVKTRKLDFKSLADSIITDMIRISARQSMTGPLAQWASTALSAYFGSSSGPITVNQTQPALTGFDQYLTKSANGNVMTSDGPMPLNMYANGGIATSPQLSIFGEGRMNEAYVPLPDGRSIPVTMSGGGGGSNVIVNVMPTGGQTADVQQRKNGDGTTTIDVILRQVQDGLADGVASGSGSLFNAIGSRFTQRGAQ